jgi:O-antigen ligase/tetratricopeptide (TPR) repeat protein
LQDKTLRPKWGWILGIFAGFTLWVGIADSIGIDPLRSFWSNYERMEGYITLLHLLALFVVTASSITKDLWYKLIGWSVAISGVAFIQGMVEHFKDTAFRIDGSFGNPTYFAVYALIHVFFAVLLAIKYKSYRYAWALCALANIIVIVYTGTRGALLGVIGGVVVAAILYALCEWKNKQVRKFSLGLLGVVVLAIISLGFAKHTQFISSSPVLSRFSELATLDVKSFIENAGRSRLAIWSIAWEGAKDSPVFGYGQDNFIQVFSTHYAPHIFDQEQWFDRTHNVFFDWLIASGFIGLFGYLAIFFATLWTLWRCTGFELYERIIITALIVGYFIHTFFVFDSITSYVFIILVWALVHAVVHVRDEDHSNKKHVHHSVNNSVQYIIGGSIMAVVIMCMITIPVYNTASNLIKGLVYTYGDGTNPANDAMIRASQMYFKKSLEGSKFAQIEIREQLVSALPRVQGSAAATSTKSDFYIFVENEIVRNVTEHPEDARVNYFAGVFYNTVNNFEVSSQYLAKALELSPKKQTIMFALADVLNRQGKTKESLDIYKQAFEADESFVEPRLRYVDALIAEGYKKEAESIMKDVSSDELLNLRYVNILASANRFDIIVKLFESELQKNPDDIQMRVSLAAAYVELGERDAAVAVLQTISRDIPQSKEQIDFFISEIKAGRNPVEK